MRDLLTKESAKQSYENNSDNKHGLERNYDVNFTCALCEYDYIFL